jgi:hypothetical protein
MHSEKGTPSINKYGEIEPRAGKVEELQYPIRNTRRDWEREKHGQSSDPQSNAIMAVLLIVVSSICLVVIGLFIITNVDKDAQAYSESSNPNSASENLDNAEIENRQLPMTPSAVIGKITPTSVPDILTVQVRSTSTPKPPTLPPPASESLSMGNFRIAYVSGSVGDTDIYVADADGTNRRCVACRSCDESEPGWSVDGLYVVYQSDCGGSYDIWYVGSHGGDATRLTYTAHIDEREPDWSPDGSQIVYRASSSNSDRNEDGELRLMNHTGQGDRSLGLRGRSPVWSPTGQSIVFMSERSGSWEIYLYDLQGDTVRQLTNCSANCRWPAWSPDGEHIIYHTTTGAGSTIADTIWKMSVSERSVTEVVSGSHAGRPSWSASAFIAFNSDRGIEVIGEDGRGRKTLIHDDSHWAPVWSE